MEKSVMKRTAPAIAALAGAALFAAAPVVAQDNDGGRAPSAEAAAPGMPGHDGAMPGMGPGTMPGQGPGMHRGQMRGKGPARSSDHRSGGAMRGCPMMMRMLFVAVDTDGSGTLTLEEVLALHERMFNAADADGDGELTPAEMRGFMMGGTGG